MSNQIGIRTYYLNKIEVLEQQILEKSQNLKRLEAQRNDLNNSGNFLKFQALKEKKFFSSSFKRRNHCIT